MLTTEEVAERFNIAQTTVHKWGQQGLINKVYSDNRNRGLWDIPPDLAIIKGRPGRNALPARVPTSISSTTEQNQYEAFALSRGLRDRAGTTAVA